jgi:hypothetical protein
MKPKTAKRLTAAQLQAAAREFDRPDYRPRFGKAPLDEQRRHDRALRQARRARGRPRVGNGALRIQVSVERSLLAEADDLARREQISRSELIARGLRLALAS